jgi:hypothetical protein
VTIGLDFSTCLQEIADSARSRQLSLWAGAGVSRDPPSALPLANELKFCILEQVCDVGGLRALYDHSLRSERDIGKNIETYPFEAFVELVCETHDVLDAIAEVFRGGHPNKNHMMFARLMKRGLVGEVLTTNFDLLIERAFEQIGWSNSRDFQVYSTEDEFLMIDPLHRLPAVFKIHGSADQERSMRVTLGQVASQALSPARAAVLEHFLASNEGSILVLGYSAGDDFDINPALARIKPKKRIFFVHHKPGRHHITSLPRPFEKCRGVSIECNTKDVTDHLERAVLGD